MTTTVGPTIAVIEDEVDTLVTLHQLLSSVQIDTDWFDSAQAFWASAHKTPQGWCVLADASAPGVLGAPFIHQLSQHGVIAPVILLVEPNDVTTAVEALRNGAADVLENPFNDQLLLDAVHAAQRRARHASLSRDRRRDLSARLSNLTSRELEVAVFVVRGCSNREIARALNISSRTVEVYRAKVMRKTGATSLCDLIRMAINANLMEMEMEIRSARAS
ncbi:LuxR C-terminal-related transcriptional regulator [Aquisalimonas sp.]|uniref:response regulator transcription factor n=1 Tax=Aquisalimonas sp. TaxID=1872621 RepID=UPI0025BD16E5|nr:LuxR C-terminal-related transcriptional regulator [Aquisalimonas sp.]